MLAILGGKPVRETFIPYGKQYIDADDVAAVSETLTSPFITSGPRVADFERALCAVTGAKHAFAVSNGTAALHAACDAIGVTAGDEVITTPMTFAASANCVLYCGGTPVFADIDPATWNLDPADVERKITKRTKAVIAVDFTGQACRIDELKAVCRKHGLVLIEDAAHSLGTKYKGRPVGSLADLTTFSFHPVKTITCGEGGAVTTDDERFVRRLNLFRSHMITRETAELSEHPFNGFNEQQGLGYNYRMTDFQAALGSSQLKKLDLFSRRRKEIVAKYDSAFAKLPQLVVQQEIPESDTTRHLYIIRLNPTALKADRNEIYRAINAENIGLQVHYIPVYYHPYYRSLGYAKGLCPVAEALYEEIITIPLYYSLTDADVDSVIEGVGKVLEHYRR